MEMAEAIRTMFIEFSGSSRADVNQEGKTDGVMKKQKTRERLPMQEHLRTLGYGNV
jgi:hypothetical protein